MTVFLRSLIATKVVFLLLIKNAQGFVTTQTIVIRLPVDIWTHIGQFQAAADLANHPLLLLLRPEADTDLINGITCNTDAV